MDYSAATLVCSIVGTGIAFGSVIFAVAKYHGKKRTEMYQHIKDTRKNIYDDLRLSDVCDERHDKVETQIKSLHDDVQEIGKDVKSLLRKNGVS